MKNEEEKLSFDVQVFPSMRVYLNCYTEDHDQLELDEFMDLVEQKGIAEFIRDLIDKGILNVYYCCFNERFKVL